MDEIVRAAQKKWPHVPACQGWLALDIRGNWYMRDEQTQAQGAFPQIKGSRIEHLALREFIERNYACDAEGQWFFQNGPQRVHVELEAAPWVWRLSTREDRSPGIESHTRRCVDSSEPLSTWLDEFDRLFLAMPHQGLGIVHSLDMEIAATALEQGIWPRPLVSSVSALAQRFGHCLSPQQVHSKK